jgi:hypothetical protein
MLDREAIVTVISWNNEDREKRAPIPPNYDKTGIRQLQRILLDQIFEEIERDTGWPIDRERVRNIHFVPVFDEPVI